MSWNNGVLRAHTSARVVDVLDMLTICNCDFVSIFVLLVINPDFSLSFQVQVLFLHI